MTSDILLSGYDRTELLNEWCAEIDKFDAFVENLNACADSFDDCPETLSLAVIEGYRAISECYTVCTLARWHSVLGYALSAEWHHARIGDDIAVMVTEKRSN